MVDEEGASLAVRGGPDSGLTIQLSQVGAFILGRGADNDFDVDDETVSRRHTLIMASPDGFVLRDLSSSNGTYLNRDRVSYGDHVLRHGDKIRLAGSGVTFVFRQQKPDTLQMDMDAPPQGDSKLPELGAKESELLSLLESHKGSVVGRQEISKKVWPELNEDTLVANQEIDKTVARLRARIEDNPRQPTHLITVGDRWFLLV